MSKAITLHNVYILATAAYLPSLIVAAVQLVQKYNLLIRAPNLKLNYALKNWTTGHHYAAAIWVGFISFLALTFIKHAARGVDVVLISLGPITLITVATVLLSNELFKLAEIYKDHSKILKTLFVISTITVSYYSKTITNSTIADYTNTNASNFPDAQSIMTILTSIGIWLYVAAIIALTAHATLAAIGLFKTIKQDILLKKEKIYNNCLIGTRPLKSARKNQELPLLLALLIGSSMTASSPLAYVHLLKASHIDAIYKKILVETSFQLSPDLCGVQAPPGSRMSLLPFKQAAIAIPDSKQTYQFSLIECVRQFDHLPSLPDIAQKLP